MKAVRLISVVAILSMLTLSAGAASADDSRGNIVLIVNGAAVTNTHAAPNTPAFAPWCASDGGCVPSVMQPVMDAATGRARGNIYVWTKNFVWNGPDMQSVCFGEFIWFALSDGDIYTNSGNSGTCGGFIAPSLKPPTHITGFGQVIAGGGDGTVTGGTGSYAKWAGGTYTDRVFVEFNFSGGANYYDQLFFSVTKS